MGYSLRSIGTWIGLISFFVAIIAVANIYIQSSLLWLFMDFWVAIILLYCLVRLIRVFVAMRRRPIGKSLRRKQQFQKLKDEVKNKVGPDYAPLQQQTSNNKGFVGLKLPSLVGFALHRLQTLESKKSSPKGIASEQKQKGKRPQIDFIVPPLAGFAPQNLGKPTSKKSSPKGIASEQKQKGKRPQIDFIVPPLAGFAPQNLRKPTSKKSSPKGIASEQKQKGKRPQIDFIVPPLAGFAPQNLRKPTSKKSSKEEEKR